MRDPGAPRPNPLFAVGGAPAPESDRAGDLGPDADDLGTDAAADDGDAGDANRPQICAACPAGPAAALFGALGDASPEAMEHLLLAGKEIIAAVRVVLDAAEGVIEQSTTNASDGPSTRGAASDEPTRSRGPRGRVHKIDLG